MTIDDYLDSLPEDQRQALQRLREQIQRADPRATECISYSRPAFRRQKVLVAFGAASKHCALYPMSASIVPRFKAELQGFSTSAGTIRFTPAKPLSEELVRRIVEARRLETGSD